MADSHDPLEAELAAMRPREISPALRQRISERLKNSKAARPHRLWPSWRTISMAGGFVAAAAAVLLLTRMDWSVQPPRPDADGPGPSGNVADSNPREAPQALPTVLVYSRALAQSPDELDALLDQHARLGSQPGADEIRVYAFTRSDDGLHPLTGEL